jgi:hypothetical protein
LDLSFGASPSEDQERKKAKNKTKSRMYVKKDLLDMLEIGVCVCMWCEYVCVCVVCVFGETEKSVGAIAVHSGMG